MRHAEAQALSRMDDLMRLLRATPRIRERTPGVFYSRGRAFLHFHEDGADLFADIRFSGDDFERVRVTSPAEQRALGRRIAAAFEPDA
ncbi:MAG: hypothetical protein GC189_09735 [Alphaproteobacteria bacterium]|nr:hypothetical protein [Alphaproteobacteria bacterium]